MLPWNQNQIMKLSSRNRVIFMRLSTVCSFLASVAITISCWSNSWLYTAEWLKYYPVNDTLELMPEYLMPMLFKNATMGPWLMCFEEPKIAFHCRPINHWNMEDSADTTMSVEIAVRKAAFVVSFSTGMAYLAWFSVLLCNIRTEAHQLMLITGVFQIVSGMMALLCLVMYVASVTREVGKKIWPETPLDKPMFYYRYGYSFYLVVASYLFTQLSAFFTLSVFMAKHDEKIFNHYQIRAFLRSADFLNMAERSSVSHRPSRFKRPSRSRETYSFSSCSASTKNSASSACPFGPDNGTVEPSTTAGHREAGERSKNGQHSRQHHHQHHRHCSRSDDRYLLSEEIRTLCSRKARTSSSTGVVFQPSSIAPTCLSPVVTTAI